MSFPAQGSAAVEVPAAAVVPPGNPIPNLSGDIQGYQVWESYETQSTEFVGFDRESHSRVYQTKWVETGHSAVYEVSADFAKSGIGSDNFWNFSQKAGEVMIENPNFYYNKGGTSFNGTFNTIGQITAAVPGNPYLPLAGTLLNVIGSNLPVYTQQGNRYMHSPARVVNFWGK